MRTSSSLVVLGLALTLAPLALAVPGQVRTLERTYDAGDLRELRLDVGVGEVTVRGTDGSRVDIRVLVRCDDDGWGSSGCPDRAEDVEIDERRHDGALTLEVEGPGMWGSRGMHLDVEVGVPARVALDLDMEVGEVKVEGLASDVSVDLGIGEVSVRMAESALASLSLDTGIGESSLRAPSRRAESSGLFTSAIDWDVDQGGARVRIELGIGEIDVRLD